LLFLSANGVIDMPPAACCVLLLLQVISEEAPVLRASQYWNLLSVDVQREDGTSSRVTGAVFGNEPHIVQVRRCVVAFAYCDVTPTEVSECW
jgi:hypothetical protein